MTRPTTKLRASRSGPGRGGAREGAGRKPRGDPAPAIYVRVTAEERAACEVAAAREGMPFTEWARRALLLRAAAHG